MRRMQREFMRHFRLLRDRVSSCPIRRDARYRKKWIPNGYGFWLKLCRSLVLVDTCGIWGRCLQVAGARAFRVSRTWKGRKELKRPEGPTATKDRNERTREDRAMDLYSSRQCITVGNKVAKHARRDVESYEARANLRSRRSPKGSRHSGRNRVDLGPK